MNLYAAYYALSKIETMIKNKLSTLKEGVVENTFGSIPEEYERVDCSDVGCKAAGHYRINFGGVSSRAYFDGYNYVVLYSSRKSGGGSKSLSLKNMDGLLEALGKTKKDDLSHKDIMDGLEFSFPGITRSISLVVKESPTLRIVGGKKAPDFEKTVEEIDHPFYKSECMRAMSVLTGDFASDVEEYGVLKIIYKEMKELKEHLKEVVGNKFEENGYVTKSTTNKFSYDSEALEAYCSSAPAEIHNYVKQAEETDADEVVGSVIVQWAGLVSDVTGDFSDDLVQVLDTMYMQAKTAAANKVSYFANTSSADHSDEVAEEFKLKL